MDDSNQKLECTFDPILVPELLNGEFRFLVPSYQRGYRWEEKQIRELLEDINDFESTSSHKEKYCMQPLVVKKQATSQLTVVNVIQINRIIIYRRGAF